MTIDIIQAIFCKILENTTFSNDLLTVRAYSKLPKLYGMENITTKEVMEYLYMFQAISKKVDEFAWLDLE